MSPDPPAALLGSAEIATHGSHDTAEQMQLEHPELHRLSTAREATEAMNPQTSRHLEPPQTESGSSLSAEVTASSSLSAADQGVDDGDTAKHDKEKYEPCVTTVAPDSSQIPTSADIVEGNNLDPGGGPSPYIVPPPRDTLSQSPSLPTTAQGDSSSQTHNHNHQTALHVPLHKTSDGAADSHDEPHEGKMIFGQHPAAIAARRRNYANSNALTDYEAELTSRDRAKQKEAVKKYLGERVKQDWTFELPQPDRSSAIKEPSSTVEEPSLAVEQPSSPQLPDAPLSPNTEDPEIEEEQWRERDEWLSDASETGDERPMPTSAASPDTPSTRQSIFQFESPDSVGDTIKKTQDDRKRRRKRRLADEMAWNNGLRCFTLRRDAWTGARHVPKSALALRAQRGSLSTEGSSTAIEHEADEEWEDDIEIPIAPPILPPENAMRASIQPGAYNTIYDKVVVQQLTPSCPMNLKDVTRSCVQGWKRDGEWPPKPTIPEPKKKGRKMSVASLFGLEKQKTQEEKPNEKEPPAASNLGVEKKPSGIRRSIQKILSLGHKEPKEGAHTNGDGVVHKESATTEK